MKKKKKPTKKITGWVGQPLEVQSVIPLEKRMSNVEQGPEAREHSRQRRSPLQKLQGGQRPGMLKKPPGHS